MVSTITPPAAVKKLASLLLAVADFAFPALLAESSFRTWSASIFSGSPVQSLECRSPDEPEPMTRMPAFGNLAGSFASASVRGSGQLHLEAAALLSLSANFFRLAVHFGSFSPEIWQISWTECRIEAKLAQTVAQVFLLPGWRGCRESIAGEGLGISGVERERTESAIRSA